MTSDRGFIIVYNSFQWLDMVYGWVLIDNEQLGVVFPGNCYNALQFDVIWHDDNWIRIQFVTSSQGIDVMTSDKLKSSFHMEHYIMDCSLTSNKI